MDNLLQHLAISRLTVRFFAGERISMRFWIGSVLRNRFLYAADQVFDEQGVSLRRHIDTLPLPEEHLLYAQLRGGFPKGFLFDCSDLPYKAPGFILEANQVYAFDLVLIGNTIAHKPLYIEAVRVMLQHGFGHPIVPLTLIDITEQPLKRYVANPDAGSDKVNVELILKTPVSLFLPAKEDGNGFQNKLNGFPSFYQFIRSITYRLMTLCILYAGDPIPIGKEQMDSQVEQYIQPAVQAFLLRANLCWEKRYNTPKKGENSVYTMGGYTGRIVFGQVPAHYLPLLAFAERLGVGANINYGLGCFQVRKK